MKNPGIMAIAGLLAFGCGKQMEMPLMKPLTLDKDTKLDYQNKIFYYGTIQGKVKRIREQYFNTVTLTDGRDTLQELPGFTMMFDEQGTPISEFSSLGADTLTKTLYQYDTAGRLTTIAMHDMRDNTNWNTQYEYDPTWGLMRKKIYGTLTTIYNYDALGKLSEAASKDSRDENGWSVTNYAYNKSSVLPNEQITTYAADKSTDLRKYAYDAAGNMTRETIERNPAYQHTTDYEYDAYHNEIRRVTPKPALDVLTDYEYDSHFNWTKKTEFTNGKKGYVWVRMIEYY